jgi:hypothetical protein
VSVYLNLTTHCTCYGPFQCFLSEAGDREGWETAEERRLGHTRFRYGKALPTGVVRRGQFVAQ